MSIEVTCGQCSATFKVKDESAGKRGKCPKCQGPIVVPMLEADAAEAALSADGNGHTEAHRAAEAPAALRPRPAATPLMQPPLVQPPLAQPGLVQPALPEFPSEPFPSAATGSHLPDAFPPPLVPAAEGAEAPNDQVKKSAKARLAPPAEPASPEFAARILAGLEGVVEPVRTTVSYRVALSIVAALMVLLPLVYVAIVAATAYGVYWHVANHWTWVAAVAENSRGRHGGKLVFAVALAYATPALAGAALVAFMLKPFLAPRRKSVPPQTLDPRQEPLLFAFVHKLCDLLGAPRPERIMLDHNVNAAAARTSSLWNPFGRKLMLVIGLPLAAGMSLRQLTGVLAHEFGHFSQGTGMWLTGVIGSINGWFAYVVYRRDHWDESLDAWYNSWEFPWSLIVGFVKGCIWCTRKILHGLMFLAHAMSCGLLREMEFDADRYEARTAGSGQFPETSARLGVLGTASRMAISDLSDSYTEKRLVDDYFRLLVLRADDMPEELRKAIEEDRMGRKVDRFDTHPPDAQRNASAAREKAPGVFRVEGPASALFADFAGLCKKETLAFYEENIGEKIPEQSLVPVEELIERQEAKRAESEAFDRVVPGLYHYLLPYPWPEKLAPSSLAPAALAARVQEVRKRLPKYVEGHDDLLEKYLEPVRKVREANFAEALLGAGYRISEDTFSEPLTRRKEVDAVREKWQAAQSGTLEELRPRLAEVVDRIVEPLQLLAVPGLAKRLPNAAQRWAEAQTLTAALAALHKHWKEILEGYGRMSLLQDHFHALQGKDEDQALVNSLFDVCRGTNTLLLPVWKSLDGHPYPFDHADGDVSIAKFLATEFPDPEQPGRFASGVERFIEQALNLRGRIVARLCTMVEEVEAALGLPRMEAPKPKPKAESEPVAAA